MGTYCIAQRMLFNGLCDLNGKSKKKGMSVYVWLIHFAIQQNLTQHCKVTIFQYKLAKSKTKLNNEYIMSLRVHWKSIIPPSWIYLVDSHQFTSYPMSVPCLPPSCFNPGTQEVKECPMCFSLIMFPVINICACLNSKTK